MNKNRFYKNSIRVVIIVLLHVNSVLLLAQFAEGGHANGDKFYAEIPFEYSYDKIVINASIEGVEGRYLVDTGAMCILFKDSTQQNFSNTQEIRIGDASGKKEMAQQVVASQINVGGLVYQDIPILYVDVFEGPFRCLGYKGIIGSNLLRFGAFKVDWQQQKLIIADSYQTIVGEKVKGSKLKVNKQQSSPFVKVKVNDRDIKWVLIDTGSGDSFALWNKTADWLQKRAVINAPLYVSDGTNSHGAWGAGEFESQIHNQINLQIGQSFFNDVIVEAGAGKSKIGMKVLEQADFILDYPQKRFFFHVKEPQSIKARSFGLDLIMKDELFVVNGVWQGSKADSLGIEKGDILVDVEGVDFKAKSACEVFLSLKDITEDKDHLVFVIQKSEGEEVEKYHLSRIKF
ncbi:aspartyl protease family protein [Carboxylicivirga sp. A043]|uniref:aspartyl protease family protein n=1 Tax=Carboxylicivirga litoralis TaxID=2816963 RepID=UPI0021CB7C48|nr:aspartyl protease family protein [Carboxylicivirga sp. A043]MCU4157357.1 aspartyl protease family protein [Carboxylicivirga sp. A043]